jgi:hypothetical protein
MKKSKTLLRASFALLMFIMIAVSCSKKKDSGDNDPRQDEPPTITSITPAEVSVGEKITIKGTGLAGAVVEVYKKLATVNSSTNTSINATVPQGIPPGQAAVAVTTNGGYIVSAVMIK